MTYFQDIFDKLFPESTKNKNGILLQEVIERNSDYSERYNRWLIEKSPETLLALEKAYQEKYLGKENEDINAHLLTSKYANGLAFSFNDKFFTKEQFAFLFDWLSKKTSDLPYKLVNSDRLISVKNGVVETKEKHYLKPIISKNEGLVNQRFGNILIEHILVEEVPSYIKITANIYSDSKYQVPQKFEKYLESIFS